MVAVTERSRQKAKAIDRMVEELALARLPRTVWASTRFRGQVIAAFRERRDFTLALRDLTSQLESTLLDVSVAAHLKARLSVMLQAADAIRRRQRRRRGLDRINEAASFLQDRLNVSPEQLHHLRLTYGESALDVARGFSDEVQAHLSREIGTSINTGEHVDDGVKRLRGAFQSMGITDTSPHLLETIFRTQTQLAWSAGEWNADQDPAIDEILWGYEYLTVGDDRVRPSHVALDGVTLPKNDPFWETARPPNGYNCRCRVLRVFDGDEQAEPVPAPGVVEVDGVNVIAGPDEGFDFNPGLLHRDILTPPTESPGIAASLKGRSRVLVALHLLGGDALQTDLCRVAGRTKGPVSAAVNALADDGLISHDPAVRGCRLTESGHARACALRELV